MVQPTVQPERGHQRRKEIPGHSQRHIQERPSTQKDLQQEHLEVQFFVYDKPRQQHQRPQQISHQRKATIARENMQLQI